MQAGEQVRLIHNPAKVGTLSNKSQQGAGYVLLGVVFADGFQWVPEDQLESAAEPLDPISLLQSGTVSSIDELGRVLTHARLSGRMTDMIYSLETTQTEYYPYQFKPVIKILHNISNGILIADDVGLGKTIEAGLIWTELRARFDYRRLLVLCPSVLRVKWQEELKRRFGITAQICDAEELVTALQHAAADPVGTHFALIGSMQGLRSSFAHEAASKVKGLKALLERRESADPLIDMLVIDEAHHLRNEGTATHALGTALRASAMHAVLLTATPINLHSKDLFELIRIIDPENFQSLEEFETIVAANRPLVRARDAVLKKKLTGEEFQAFLGDVTASPVLKDLHSLQALVHNPPTTEALADAATRTGIAHVLEEANLLGQVINRTRKRDAHLKRVIRKPYVYSAPMSVVERDVYDKVTEIVRDYCSEHTAGAGFLLTMPQRQMASCIPAAYRYWLKSDAKSTLGFEDGDAPDALKRDEAQEGLVNRLRESIGGVATYEQLWQSDTKYQHFEGALAALWSSPDYGDKVIVFSTFRETLAYLAERLRAAGGVSVFELNGDTKDKDALIRDFQGMPGRCVLLSSEVGSEGVDLQFARVIVNYDLPWNPMRIEQRIGRVDRLGQTAPTVAVVNLMSKDTIDDRIYLRLYERIGIFHDALGSLDEILGEEIARLSKELFAPHLTPADEVALIDQAAVAIATQKATQEVLDAHASELFALGDTIAQQVDDTRRLGRRVTDHELMAYVLAFIRAKYPDCVTDVGGDPLRRRLFLSAHMKVDLQAFMARLKVSEGQALVAAVGGGVMCEFRNRVGSVRSPGVELVHQFHPLVRFAREALRLEHEDLRLAVAGRVAVPPDGVPVGDYAFMVNRWSALGVNDKEQLWYAAIPLGGGSCLPSDVAEQLVAGATVHGEAWHDAAACLGGYGDAVAGVMQLERDVRERFEMFRRTEEAANHDRATLLLEALRRHVERQMQRYEELVAKHESDGNVGLTKATEKQMQNFIMNADMRKARLEKQKATTVESHLVLVGVLRVGG